ncbi:MAG: glycoside hydrolase family 3 N-terminal domain-containing protein [Actinomycetota bacterium]|nr:glycoside hydrolase family 3 N-terminal domain-containing protein [Actinomycetota bacterium]
MTRFRFLALVMATGATTLSLGLVSISTNPAVARASASTSNLTCAQRIVASWSLTHVARETIVVSAQASDLARVTSAAAQGYGGFLLFGASAPTSLPTTISSLARLEPDARAPMVMTDDEGGGIIRFSNLVGQWPWAQVMGSTMTPAQVTRVGYRVGVALAKVGLNVDLAPVADLDARAVWPGPANPDGLRSFGGSAPKAAADVVAFANGLRSAHVLAVVKHFPGLGHSTGNTDVAPAATVAWSVLQKSGLVPFRRAIADGVGAVMMSNASIPGLTKLPAGLSAAAVGQLRHQLGFRGLIMSDALGAGAISARHLTIAQASVDALAAGVDQVLASNPSSFQQSLQTASLTTAALVAAVAQGTLTRARLVDGAAHVLAATNSLQCAE